VLQIHHVLRRRPGAPLAGSRLSAPGLSSVPPSSGLKAEDRALSYPDRGSATWFKHTVKFTLSAHDQLVARPLPEICSSGRFSAASAQCCAVSGHLGGLTLTTTLHWDESGPAAGVSRRKLTAALLTTHDYYIIKTCDKLVRIHL
jgi:hypothetical protein